MVESYFPVLLAFGVAVLLALGLFGLSSLLSPKRPTKTKGEPYECGIPSLGSQGERPSVKFFLTAVLFLLFDVEAVFLFPWAVVYREFIRQGAGTFLLLEMGFFLAILLLGLVYVIKRGALEWE